MVPLEAAKTPRSAGILAFDKSRAAGKPFFAYAAYTAPHWPPQFIDRDAGRYDAVFARKVRVVASVAEQFRDRERAIVQAGVRGDDVAGLTGVPATRAAVVA